jgi:hypothetical protein
VGPAVVEPAATVVVGEELVVVVVVVVVEEEVLDVGALAAIVLVGPVDDVVATVVVVSGSSGPAASPPQADTSTANVRALTNPRLIFLTSQIGTRSGMRRIRGSPGLTSIRRTQGRRDLVPDSSYGSHRECSNTHERSRKNGHFDSLLANEFSQIGQVLDHRDARLEKKAVGGPGA